MSPVTKWSLGEVYKMPQEIKEIVKIIKKGGIGVMPTDTLYGLVGSAFSKKAVLRIYKVRKREKDKPFIILISSIADLRKFNIKLSARHLTFLKKIWPGPVSVILHLGNKKQKTRNKLFYLHRGANTLAFRLPKNKQLQNILRKTGPLVAPSANISGKLPATTITEARKYFGNNVDFYLDGGRISREPSLLLEIKR